MDVPPHFARAGRAASTTFWENRLIDVANGAPGNAQAIQRALSNRSRAAYGWHHDAQRLEHSGPDGAPVAIETSTRNTIDVRSMSVEDRDALRGILLRAGARDEDQARIGHSED